MATINVVDESGTLASSINSIRLALQVFSDQVTDAWGLPRNGLVTLGVRNASSWNVCFVNQFPNPAMQKTAYGYHEIVNGEPIAYIRVDSFGKRNPLGFCLKPLIVKGIKITPGILTPGIASVAMHELAEMIVDPQVNRYATDPLNRNWIMEVCDHTVGKYAITIPNANVVAPDFTLPSFYDITGTAPYSHLNVPSKPFTLVSGGYGYFKDSMGIMHKL